MAQYSVDFSSYTLNTTPSDWRSIYRAGSTAHTLEVVEDSQLASNKVLKIDQTENGRVGYVWDGVPNDADSDQISLFFRVRFPGSIEASEELRGLMQAADVTTSSVDGYTSGPREGGTILQMYEGDTDVSLGTNTKTYSPDIWYNVLFEGGSGGHNVRVWEAGTEEPVSWEITSGDLGALSTGVVGFFAYFNCTAEIDYLGVGTGGDIAPRDSSVPYELVVVEVEPSSALVKWEGTSSTHDLEYRLLNDIGNETRVNDIGATYYRLDGLSSNVNYEVRVRGVSQSGDSAWTSWVGFKTADPSNQYYWSANDYNVGDIPTDAWEITKGSAVHLEIKEDTYGKYMEITGSDSSRQSVKFKNAPISTDGTIWARHKGASTGMDLSLALRTSGMTAGSTFQGVRLDYLPDSQFRLSEYNSGSFSVLANRPTKVPAGNEGEIYGEVTGSTVKGKSWYATDHEPSLWDLESTTTVTASGEAGLYLYDFFGLDWRIYAFGVGTNGEPAPRSEPTGGTTVDVSGGITSTATFSAVPAFNYSVTGDVAAQTSVTASSAQTRSVTADITSITTVTAAAKKGTEKDCVLRLDGSDDYVELPPGLLEGVSELTVEASINPSNLKSIPVNDRIVCNDGANVYQLTVDADGFEFRVANSSGDWQPSVTAPAPPTGARTHVAGVYDGADCIIYVDGDEKGRVTIGSITTATPNQVSAIGANVSPDQTISERWFDGKINDVRLWSVARTQSEIQSNKDSYLTGNEAGLDAYYPMRECSGSTLYDYAADNDGTIVGATWVTTYSATAAVLSQTSVSASALIGSPGGDVAGAISSATTFSAARAVGRKRSAAVDATTAFSASIAPIAGKVAVSGAVSSTTTVSATRAVERRRSAAVGVATAFSASTEEAEVRTVSGAVNVTTQYNAALTRTRSVAGTLTASTTVFAATIRTLDALAAVGATTTVAGAVKKARSASAAVESSSTVNAAKERRRSANAGVQVLGSFSADAAADFVAAANIAATTSLTASAGAASDVDTSGAVFATTTASAQWGVAVSAAAVVQAQSMFTAEAGIDEPVSATIHARTYVRATAAGGTAVEVRHLQVRSVSILPEFSGTATIQEEIRSSWTGIV